jgi:hypothetical protein
MNIIIPGMMMTSGLRLMSTVKKRDEGERYVPER